VEALLIIDSSSAAGVPFSRETIAMREKTFELALNEGIEAVARFAIEDSPNIVGRAKRASVETIKDM
jgi:hypothetical protein